MKQVFINQYTIKHQIEKVIGAAHSLILLRVYWGRVYWNWCNVNPFNSVEGMRFGNNGTYDYVTVA